MKRRVAHKKNKALLDLSLVCERIAINVIDKVSYAFHLQRDIDEYERFLGDMLIMLIKGEPQCVIEHSVQGDDKMGWIWDEVRKLIKENKELKAKLALAQDLKEKQA